MDTIELTDPNPDWPNQFRLEKDRLERILKTENIVAIEHFGSTAVPGMVAKPIIDILVEVPDLNAAKERFPSLLENLEYTYWADNPKTDRMFFVKGMPPYGKQRTHHVHVGETGAELSDGVKFRDFLRVNADRRQEYANLKKILASQHTNDRDAYTDAKSTFVASIMEQITKLCG